MSWSSPKSWNFGLHPLITKRVVNEVMADSHIQARIEVRGVEEATRAFEALGRAAAATGASMEAVGAALGDALRSMSLSVATEAPEDVMGVVESQQRQELAAITEQALAHERERTRRDSLASRIARAETHAASQASATTIQYIIDSIRSGALSGRHARQLLESIGGENVSTVIQRYLDQREGEHFIQGAATPTGLLREPESAPTVIEIRRQRAVAIGRVIGGDK